jgi:hypothetical protein
MWLDVRALGALCLFDEAVAAPTARPARTAARAEIRAMRLDTQ